MPRYRTVTLPAAGFPTRRWPLENALRLQFPTVSEIDVFKILTGTAQLACVYMYVCIRKFLLSAFSRRGKRRKKKKETRNVYTPTLMYAHVSKIQQFLFVINILRSERAKEIEDVVQRSEEI